MAHHSRARRRAATRHAPTGSWRRIAGSTASAQYCDVGYWSCFLSKVNKSSACCPAGERGTNSGLSLTRGSGTACASVRSDIEAAVFSSRGSADFCVTLIGSAIYMSDGVINLALTLLNFAGAAGTKAFGPPQWSTKAVRRRCGWRRKRYSRSVMTSETDHSIC